MLLHLISLCYVNPLILRSSLIYSYKAVLAKSDTIHINCSLTSIDRSNVQQTKTVNLVELRICKDSETIIVRTPTTRRFTNRFIVRKFDFKSEALTHHRALAVPFSVNQHICHIINNKKIWHIQHNVTINVMKNTSAYQYGVPLNELHL